MFYGNVKDLYAKEQVKVLPEPIQAALRFLEAHDMGTYPAGAHPMEIEGVPMIVSVMDLETKPREACYPEIHRKYIDVQYFVSGEGEKSTYYIDRGNGTVHEDLLDTEKDILFYENDPAETENAVYMQPGAYAIFLPWDVHVPGQNPGNSSVAFRKVVVKVPLEACLR